MEQEHTVEVREAGEVVFTWTGYADNVTDALYRALDARQDQV